MSQRSDDTPMRRHDGMTRRHSSEMAIPGGSRYPWLPHPASVALLILGAVYYLDRIAQWFAYDDEGGYLYAAWRIGSGELPYRDFLTPKLPAFLYPGALLLRLTDNSVFSLRALSALLVLTSIGLLYLTLRRVWGDRVAVLAMVPCLIQRDMFWAARFFRPEAYMLFWDALGLYLFVMSYHTAITRNNRPPRWGLAASSIAFALATLSNLFGLLPLLGCLLFVASRARRGGTWRMEIEAALWLVVPCALVGGLATGAFLLLAPSFLKDVLGHHLRQGRQLLPWQVAAKGLRLYWDYCRTQPILVSLALVGAIRTLRMAGRRSDVASHADIAGVLKLDPSAGKDVPLASLFVWQLPTALAFSLISRDLQARHLVYLVPSLGALVAAALDPLWGSGRQRWVAWAAGGAATVLVLGAALYPSWRDNRLAAGMWERDTQQLAAYIQAHTGPDDYVLSDYPGLNFFARRKAPPTAAGISRGAAKSGQITGRVLIGEIEAYNVQMVILNVAQGAHQLASLTDYPLFKQYVQTHFALAQRFIRDYRLLELYHRQDLWQGSIVNVDFGGTLRLTGLRWTRTEAPPGRDVQVEMRWQSMQPMEQDYLVTLVLYDEEGHQWGLGSKQLVDVDVETYWDERGLEQPVLISTSQWPVGEVTIDASELPIALATPPGTYTATVRVHPSALWEGLPVLSPGGMPSGFDYPVGEVEVLSAPQPPALEDLDIVQIHEADMGRGIQLLGWDISSTDVRPGDKVHLSLLWRTQRVLSRDYTARLQLVDESERSGGKILLPPTGTQYPTHRWRAGEILLGQADLTVDAAAVSGTYALGLNLLDEAGESLQASDLELGTVAVSGRVRRFDLPSAIQHTLAVEFGGLVRLLGYDLPHPGTPPGGTFPLTLYWRSLRRMDTSYTVFTHLLDEQGRIWGQQDNVPQQGGYPTTGWLPDEVVVDEYEIPARDDTPEGTYLLEIGLYDAATGIRLPAVKTDETLLGDHLLLPEAVLVAEEP